MLAKLTEDRWEKYRSSVRLVDLVCEPLLQVCQWVVSDESARNAQKLESHEVWSPNMASGFQPLHWKFSL